MSKYVKKILDENLGELENAKKSDKFPGKNHFDKFKGGKEFCDQDKLKTAIAIQFQIGIPEGIHG